MNIDNLTIDELIELRDSINDRINTYKDGYEYICKVRSYGRNWREHGIYNVYTLQELCDRYSGEDGIVDVYSTNPNLLDIHNYGNVMYIESEKDLEIWEKIQYYTFTIPELEESIRKWENRDDVPYDQRPLFRPTYGKEEIDEMKIRLEELKKQPYTRPISYYKLKDDESI